jgi:hypothetical protein
LREAFASTFAGRFEILFFVGVQWAESLGLGIEKEVFAGNLNENSLEY